jgi:lipoate-protein ligase A
VLVAGRKVLGLSQARRRPGTLLQAGVLLSVDGPLTARLMGREPAFGAALAAHAAGLNEWDASIEAGDVVDAVNTSVMEVTGHTLTPSQVTAAERAAVAAAMAELGAPVTAP